MAAMDALPDELLLHILSFVGDARTLLDAVPLVCKRWHRLHREPAVWAGVDLKFVDFMEKASTLRYLLHAPAAYSFAIVGYSVFPVDDDPDDPLLSISESYRRLVSALLRSNIVLCHVDLSKMELRPELYAVVIGFLRCQRDHLRSLDLRVPLREAQVAYYGSTLRGSEASLLESLAELRRLERLKVHLGVELDAAYIPGYAGGLSVLSLKELIIENTQDFSASNVYLYSKLITDLIDGFDTALPSLRLLELPMSLQHKDIADAVVEQERLEELTLCVQDDEVDENDVYQQVDATLNVCLRVGSLRRLRIRFKDYVRYDPYVLRALFEESVRAFRECRPDVTVTFWDLRTLTLVGL